MNLTIRQLTTFREVLRTGSISEAGRTLGRTQPSVSAMIAGLENEIGFRLFEREHGRLTPTPEAHYFLEEAEAVLSRLTQSTHTLQEISNLKRGRLRVACHPAASGFFMPGVLGQFLQDKPAIKASLMMRSSKVIEELIASQQYDLGFTETPEPRKSIHQQDFDLECLCAMPASDPLAAKSLISTEDLDGANLATLFSEHPTFLQTSAAFKNTGKSFERRFELRTFLPGLQFVKAGLCYLICDLITAFSCNDPLHGTGGIVFRRFSPRISSSVSILTPAHRPASLITQSFSQKLAEDINAMKENVFL